VLKQVISSCFHLPFFINGTCVPYLNSRVFMYIKVSGSDFIRKKSR